MIKCETCRFWELQFSEGDSEQRIDLDSMEASRVEHIYTGGLCRINAPVVHAHETAEGGWPTTKSTDWCGRHCSKSDLWKFIQELEDGSQ